jgi:hypothetical protein
MRFPRNPKKNSMPSKAQSAHAKRLFQWKQEGVKASSEYEAKEQATRLLTAKLRAERLAREAMSGKRDQKKSAKAQAENHRLAAIAAGRCRQLNSMSDDIEIQFRGGYPKKWHSESTPQVRPKT